MLCDQLCKLVLVGSHHFFDLFASLVKVERGHGTNRTSGRNVVGLVDVHLDKFRLGIFFRQFLKNGSNVFARTTPVVMPNS